MDAKVFETTIILDDDKVKESPYSKESIYAYLDKVFTAVGMVRVDNTFKHGTFAEVGGAMSSLFKLEWFMKMVKEWTLVEKDGEHIVSTENVLGSKLLRKRYLNKYGL